MTVAELIKRLSDFSPAMEVYYTAGADWLANIKVTTLVIQTIAEENKNVASIVVIR